MIFFASNSLLCRAALADGLTDATSFTTLRLASGALTLALLARARGAAAPASGGGWPSAVALFAYAIGFSLAYLRLSAGMGALLLFGAVQITMVGAGLRAGERPPLRQWAGLLLSIAGFLALIGPGLSRPDPAGAALMSAAGLAWGIYSLRGRRVTDALSANAVNFVRSVPLALAASAVALIAGAPRLTTSGMLLAVASGAVASGVGYAIWYAAVRRQSATQAALVQLSVPPLAALGGVLLLGESLTGRLIYAGTAILGGIAIAVTAGKREST
jgi:drug/metabolite transporter (DMT)-like permease